MKPQDRGRVPGHRLLATLAAGAIGLVAVLPGCSPAVRDAPPCMPPTYTVNPSVARVGDTVTIEAPDSDCDPRYGQGARIQVTVTDAVGRRILRTTAPMSDAGGFAYSFDVPPHARPGRASVEAYPYGVDWCDDTGRNNRVSDAEVSLLRASCVARLEPLMITHPK